MTDAVVTDWAPDVATQIGRAARESAPRSSHGAWTAADGRPDPVRLIEGQNANRIPWLVPIRHRRMGASAFTFYRGTAQIMAADLADTPTSGLTVQLSGDAHLSNFGAYASPSRQLVFDANDFDETLRGPWEWDLKRLAASFMIAGQDLGFTHKQCRAVTTEVTRAYRTAMREFGRRRSLDVWYDVTRVADVQPGGAMSKKELEKRVKRFTRRATKKTSMQALAKLTEEVAGERLIRSDPPVLYPLRALPAEYDSDELQAAAAASFEAYKGSLDDDRRLLLDRYRLVDVGLKVVGVGSVGTLSMVLHLEGRHDPDPLFLQAKEAGPSALEEYLPPSPYDNHGRRVVEGQRLIQAESDIFLGWAEGLGPDHRQFYVRQLRDWKGSVNVEHGTPDQVTFYATLCGRTLARGHARSGDAVAIAAYAGKGDRLDRAVTEFAARYAEQNLADYEQFEAAIDDGRLEIADPE